MTFSTLASPGVSLQGGGGSGGGGTASLPISGNGATITTSTPLIDGTQTWNSGATTFTSLLLNVTDTASAAGSLLMDLQVGGSSRFRVSKSGNATGTSYFSGEANNQIIIGTGTGVGNAAIRWKTGNIFAFSSGDNSVYIPIEARYFAIGGYGRMTNGDAINGNIRFTNFADTGYAELQFGSLNFQTDLFLTRRAAANLRLGAADAAAPVAQTLSVQSVVAGTTNTAGANLTITGSQGTGTGAGGSIIFQVAPAGSTGTAQNALVSALTIDAENFVRLRPASTTGSLLNSGDNGFRTLQLLGPTYGSNGVAAIRTDNFVAVRGGGGFAWESGANNPATGTLDLILARDAANTLALRNGTAAQAFNLYNSYTDASNYSRLTMYADGSANYYIGTQKAGTGTSASLFVGTGVGSGVAGNGALTLAGASVQFATQVGNVFNITAGGVMSFNADNTYDIGGSAGNRPRSVYVATSVTPGRGVTVAGLPTPSTGMIARVTDALAPTIGATVTGGGAAYALVNYNGANWTVIGI